MHRTVDVSREIVLQMEPGVYTPALRVHLMDGEWNNPRPAPHEIPGFASCRDLTVKHNDDWYVVFTDTTSDDTEHMIVRSTYEAAYAFLVDYRERQAVLAAEPDITVLERDSVSGRLRYRPGTPYESEWLDLGFGSTCECGECGDEVEEYYLCLDGGEVLCGKHVQVISR